MDAAGSFLAQHPRPPFYIALVIGVPSLLLYATEVALLLRHRRTVFHSPFYHLFLIRACFNILNYCNTYVYQRFAQLGLFTDFYESQSPRYSLLAATWFLY